MSEAHAHQQAKGGAGAQRMTAGLSLEAVLEVVSSHVDFTFIRKKGGVSPAGK
ncbi:hypothetical protein [Achromobacter sp. NFACC18-2]|uniref:hypothetical protein n=1 Tax=Achromobacter sp. NFACC18-2 TaxID=1564112 RepID=UPI001587BE80|nr:hypothetical protein [Achromobacter sp. NFACC18-2]